MTLSIFLNHRTQWIVTVVVLIVILLLWPNIRKKKSVAVVKSDSQKSRDVDFITYVCEQLKASNVTKDKAIATQVITTNIEELAINFVLTTKKNSELLPTQPAIDAIAEKYATMV